MNGCSAEIDRSHRLAASSKILLRMSAKKNVKGRVSDAGNHSLVDQDAQQISKCGEAIHPEMNETGEHVHEPDPRENAQEAPCAGCQRNDQLEMSMKKMDYRMSKVEGQIAELRTDVQGLRELLERAVHSGPVVALSSRSLARAREPEPTLPAVSRKRQREEANEKQGDDGEVEASERPGARERSSSRRRKEEKKGGEKEIETGSDGKKEKSRKEDKKERRKDKSRSAVSVPAFDLNEMPSFDTYSVSQQIIALAHPDSTPSNPETDTPPLRIPIEKIPYAIFLLVSESLPPSSRCSLNELRVLWSGNSTARKVGDWLQVKLPYLHTAMKSAVVGKATDVRIGHRNFTMSDPRWPASVQIPKLTCSIIAASTGLIKDPTANTGAFVRDACTICDMQSPDTPLSWRRWLDKGRYDIETVPAAYKEQVRNMCGIPFAAFLRETKAGEGKKRR
ncbi:hypothetical protein FRC06_011333 [Ceratobasidium sp. 370]|nr:hypothetical protein FRC06_011333 [Ceratobasidium sp. 370]